MVRLWLSHGLAVHLPAGPVTSQNLFSGGKWGWWENQLLRVGVRIGNTVYEAQSWYTGGEKCFCFLTPTNPPILCRHRLGALQFSLYPNHWSSHQTPWSSGFRLKHRTAFFSDPSCKYRTPGYRLLPNLATKSRVPITLLFGFDNLREWLTKLKKCFYLLLAAHYKGYSSRIAKWKRCVGQDVGGGRSFRVPSRYATLLALLFAHQPGSSLKHIVCRFLWMFHYVGMIDDSIDHWRHSISSSSHLSPWGVGLSVPNSNQGLVFLMTSPFLKLPEVLPRVAKSQVRSLKICL